MPTWKTPGPITVIVDVGAGDIQLVATDRDDTVVTITPSSELHRDAEAPRSASVDFASNTLTVSSPRKWTRSLFGAGRDSMDIRIELPARSNVRIQCGFGSVTCAGTFAECHVKTGFGEIIIGDSGPLTARSGAGNISIHRATKHCEASTGSGHVRIENLDCDGVIRSSHGDLWVGCANGGPDQGVLVRSAAGRIDIDSSSVRLEAKTSAGDVRVGTVTAGSVNARTAYGALNLGIADGVAAYLDLNTSFGNVRNALDDAPRPGPNDTSVEVAARTAFGDITIRRAEVDVAKPSTTEARG